MWRIPRQEKPEDFVIATGVTKPAREFIRMAFAEVGIQVEFSGEGVEEVGRVVACHNPEFGVEIGKEVVSVDARYFRPTEVDLLLGDPTKAKEKLGWELQYDLPALVKDMMQADVNLFRRDQLLEQSGHRVMNYYE